MKMHSHGVTIHSEFSGGNILVDTCDGYHVELRPDMRDTTGHWFYWPFEVQVESTRRLHFHFPKDQIPFIGVHGPAVSADGGRSWDWLYANAAGTQILPNRLREFGASLTEALIHSVQAN